MRDKPRERLFTFKSGGWVLLAGIAFSVAGAAWNLAPLFKGGRPVARGDGRHAATYGFDLAQAIVPASEIVSGGLVVDGMKALVDPAMMRAAEVSGLEAIERGKYLVPSDKVVGLEIDGDVRAYPLRVLVWHEVVNDVVGGVPVAVTYSPLSGGIVVFDRRVAGETLTFGVSGLLLDSNLLLYDRREGNRGESLWSQLRMRAVAGPAAAAGRELARVPFRLARWDEWIETHPRSAVLAPLLEEASNYKKDIYGSYYNSEQLRFPVDPLPPAGSPPPKTRIQITGEPGAWRLHRLEPSAGDWKFEIEGPGETAEPAIFAFWFAWYAAHPDDPGSWTPE